MNRLVAVLSSLLALLALPAVASASTVSKTGSTISYIADAQEINDVSISLAGDVYTINEQGNSPGKGGITVKDGGGCQVAPGSTTATCPAAGTTLLNIELGDQGDTAQILAPTAARIIGGDGNDSLTGGDANDQLFGAPGNDTLNGGGGDDGLEGGADGDAINGGAGTDTADYSNRTEALTVTLDGQQGDGEMGENDNVGTDVEAVNGGSAGDTLTGNDADNVLNGNAGNDTLNGQGGNDTLNGGDGDDTLNGGPGGDTISGGNGTDSVSYAGSAAPVRVSLDGAGGDGAAGENDNIQPDVENVGGGNAADVLIGNAGANALAGGPGDDRLLGGAGSDVLDGGDGNDAIQALDRAVDQVVCGNGTDGTVADTADVLNACETVERALVRIVTRKSKMRRGAVRVALRCSAFATEGCNGTLRLRYRRTALGRKAYRLASGAQSTQRVRLTRKSQRLLKRRHRLAARATATTRDATGTTSTARKRVRLTA